MGVWTIVNNTLATRKEIGHWGAIRDKLIDDGIEINPDEYEIL